MLDDAAMAVMVLNGGSAVPLWNTWLDGLQEEAPEGNEIDTAGIQAIFAKALKALSDMSGAKVGDKTMMDALIPASQAIAAYSGSDEAGLFDAAAQAALQGPRPASSSSPSSAVPRATASRPIGTPGCRGRLHGLFLPGAGTALSASPLILNGRYSIYENEEVYQLPRDHHRRGAGGSWPGLPRHSGGGRPSSHQQGPGRRRPG